MVGMRTRRGTVLLSAATLVIFAVAWFTGRQVGVSTSLTTRLYDVRELLIGISNYDDPPYLGLDPGERKRSPPPPTTVPSVDQKLDELLRLIRSTIDADSWDQPGRSLTRLNHHIAVTNTPQTHQKVADLLQDLRAARSTVIQVEARLMSVDAAALERLPPSVRDRIAANDTSPLSQAQADAILADLNRANAKTISAPRVSVFSGQRAYVMVGNQRAYVAGLRHVVKNGVTTFEPEVDVAQSGHLLDLHAIASPDRKEVTFTLRAQFAQFLEMQTVEQHKMPSPGGKALVQRPVIDLHAVRTTVTTPVGQTLLLWRFDRRQSPTTLPATQPATLPATAERFLLFIRPTIPSPSLADSRPTTLPSRNPF
jgi:hypothetical protein